jgi:hypothetical protein
MTTNAQEWIDRADVNIGKLRDLKESLDPQLENIKVKVDKVRNADLYKSVEALFGSREGEPDDGFITFGMYSEALKIIRAGGKAKAADFLKDRNL